MELYMLVDEDDGIAEVGSYEKCKRLYDRWKKDWEADWDNYGADEDELGIKLAIVKVVTSYEWKDIGEYYDQVEEMGYENEQ